MENSLIFILYFKTGFQRIYLYHISNFYFGSVGVIFYQNEDGDVMDIQADIIGPRKSIVPFYFFIFSCFNLEDTPFHNGFFRCKLVIDGDFPTKPPKGFFLTKIFHPNVSEKGEICVNTLKRDWDPAKWSLSHIF